MKLTTRQQRFVDNYILSGNGAQSARDAGYSGKCANRIATENLSKPDIKQAIEEKQREIAEAKGITRDNALAILWKDAKEAEKPVDRKGAVDSIAKIMGWTKENTSVNVAYFTQLNDNKEDTEKQ